MEQFAMLRKQHAELQYQHEVTLQELKYIKTYNFFPEKVCTGYEYLLKLYL